MSKNGSPKVSTSSLLKICCKAKAKSCLFLKEPYQYCHEGWWNIRLELHQTHVVKMEFTKGHCFLETYLYICAYS